MAKSFDNLRRQVRQRPGADARIEAHKEALRVAIRLADLRGELDKTQAELAALMNTTQENVSRMERSENPYLSTLAFYVAALGGSLQVNAVFEDRVIPIAEVQDREEALS